LDYISDLKSLSGTRIGEITYSKTILLSSEKTESALARYGFRAYACWYRGQIKGCSSSPADPLFMRQCVFLKSAPFFLIFRGSN